MGIRKAEQCAEKAMVRRFGASLMPYAHKVVREKVLRTTDVETGNWCEFDFSAWRIRRVAEYDEAARS